MNKYKIPIIIKGEKLVVILGDENHIPTCNDMEIVKTFLETKKSKFIISRIPVSFKRIKKDGSIEVI